MDRSRNVAPSGVCEAVRLSWQMRQVERSQPIEPLPPKAELHAEHFALHRVTLPGGKIRILNRQLRQRHLRAPGQRGVRVRQFTHQNFLRPRVRDDVMQTDHKHLLRLAGLQQRGAHQRPLAEMERPLRFLANNPHHLRLPRRRRDLPQVHHGQMEIRTLRHKLHRLTIHRAKSRAQDLVPRDHLRECPVEQTRVHASVDAKRPGHIVQRIARLDLVDKPEPALGERCREHPAIPAIGLRLVLQQFVLRHFCQIIHHSGCRAQSRTSE